MTFGQQCVPYRRRLVLLAVGFFSSCSSPPDTPDQFESLTVNTAEWSVSAPRVFVVPETGDNPPLFQVRTAIKLPTGEVAASNTSSNHLIFFNAASRFERTSGGFGGGPGEFSALQTIWLTENDSIGAWDPLGQRITILALNGVAGREIMLDLGFIPQSLQAFRDGSYLATRAGPLEYYQPETTVLDSSSLFLIDPFGRLSADIGRAPNHSFYFMRRPSGGIGRTGFPLLPQGFVAVGDQEFYVGLSSSWQIVKHAQDGAVLDTIRLSRARQPFTGVERQEWIDTLLARATSTRPMSRGFLEGLPYPDSVPAFDSMLVDDLGYLWVREFHLDGHPAPEWIVFDSSGNVAATLTLPARLRPTHIGGDFVVGVQTDSLDTETVVALSLTRERSP